MSFKEVRRVSLWDKDLIDPLIVGLRIAPGTAEYEDLGRDLTPSPVNDFCAIGLPGFNPSQPGTHAKMQCSLCKVSFTTREEQVEHYRLDWHRCNLQRSVNKKAPLTEEQFMNDLNDVSSISGSEEGSDDEDTEDDKISENDEAGQSLGRQARMFFLNADGMVLSLYRAVLLSKKCKMTGEEDAVLRARSAAAVQPWAVILLSGGHFAAAIFKGNEVVMHKTFHNYTVRSKQGGSQRGKDNQSGTSHPRSSGASLRRYNEMSQRQHIQELMESWKPRLALCKLIFYLAKTHNRSTLFSGKSAVLNVNDSRLRTIPFPTRRPKFSEVKRVYELLSAVYVHGTEEEFNSLVKDANAKNTRKPLVPKKNNSPVTKAERKPKSLRRNSPVQFTPSSGEESGEDSVDEITLVTSMVTISTRDLGGAEGECSFDIDKMRRRAKKNETRESSKKKPSDSKNADQGSKFHDLLYSASRTGNISDLSRLLKKPWEKLDEGISSSTEINDVTGEALPEDISEITFGPHCKTMLHVAAENSQNETIWWLMENGCDPSIADGRGRLPYNVSRSKDTKNIFQKFVAVHPEKFDYLKAKIPVPRTPEEEEKQAAVLAERKKAKKKAQKEKAKKKKEEEETQKREEEEKARFLELSDREKRALAAERRLQQQCKKADTPAVVHSRCFLCGTNITDIPFEYSDNKFCSIRCVKEHRSKNV